LPAPEHLNTRTPEHPCPAIEAKGLTKRFGPRAAVDGVTFQVPPGEIFGLVGPDGAGKTTTMRLLLGLLPADGGAARVLGHDMLADPEAARPELGYVSQRFSLYGDLTVAENIAFAADLRRVPRSEREARARELLALTELAPFTDRLARNLSGGMRQKLALVCGLIHQPRALFLDEPTTGVDPVSRRDFWQLLYGLPEQGITLLVSTPYIDEAQRCNRLGFMASGRLLAVDTAEGLVSRMPDALVDIETTDRPAARRALKARPGVRRVESVGTALRVALAPADPAAQDDQALAVWLRAQGVPVDRSSRPAPTLDDVFGALSEATK
jgi:drug efflux transport system ATP-binding protein